MYSSFSIVYMSGLDRLLAVSLQKTIEKNLGEEATKKIENRLFEKFGLSLTQAVEEFQKIDLVLREYFGSGADGLEKQFLKNICKVKSRKSGSNWFTIEDENIAKIILEAYGDEDKAKILNSVLDDEKIISSILKECKIPQTSGYRKINSLIEKGLLIVKGTEMSHDGRRVNRYISLFDNIRINVDKNKITIDIQLLKPNFNDSSILQVVFS